MAIFIWILGVPITFLLLIIPYLILLVVENKKHIRIKKYLIVDNKYYKIIAMLAYIYIVINFIASSLFIISCLFQPEVDLTPLMEPNY